MCGLYWEARVGMSKLKFHFPGLKFHIPYLWHRPQLVASMAKWMKSVAQKTCSDDANRLKDQIVELLELPDNVKEKTSRGFRHTSTSWLLCPISLINQFDKDLDRFCRCVHDMRKGRPRVSAADYPLFMYDMDEYVPGKVKPGLFKSPTMLAAPTAAKTSGADTAAGDGEESASVKVGHARGLQFWYSARGGDATLAMGTQYRSKRSENTVKRSGRN
ncbi:hypothetical protein BC628DRAFT_1342609 [Trametes gibbosa]|nr:hypothetical protein BC628DRAFT_1342609 [Trametes gibbosa]